MYLIDTNLVIYHLNDIELATQFLIEHRDQMAISTITVAEVLSYPMSENELQAVKVFLEENFIWLEISQEIIFESAKIRRQKKIKLPDAIIGATAICRGLKLVSRNEKDFAHLPIELINPID